MKRYFYIFLRKIFFLILTTINLHAFCIDDIDSLKNELLKSPGEKEKLGILTELTFYYRHTDMDSFRLYGSQAIALASKLKDTAQLIKSYRFFSSGFYHKAIYDSSLAYNLKALSLLEFQNDHVNSFKVNNNIALIYEYAGDFRTALDYYEQALFCCDKLAEYYADSGFVDYSYAALFNNIGLSYRSLNQNDSAIMYFDKCVQISGKINDKYLLSSAYHNIGLILIDKYDYDSAFVVLSKSLMFADENANLYMKTHAMIGLAELNYNRKDYKLALSYLTKGLYLAKSINSKENLRDAYHILSELYQKTGLSSEAVKYLNLYHAYTDTLDKQKLNTSISLLMVKRNLEKKEQQLKVVQIEKNIAESKRQNARKWIIAILSGAIALIVLVILFIFQFVGKNRAYAFIAQRHYERLKSEQFDTAPGIDREIMDIVNRNETTGSSLKYSSSVLNEEQKVRILLTVKSFLKSDKLFLDPDFTLTVLSEKVNIPRMYISQVINEKSGSGFNNYINSFRVDEAVKILSSKESRMFTIEHVAHQVGFRSKSAFYQAFKFYTGITPNVYLKQISRFGAEVISQIPKQDFAA